MRNSGRDGFQLVSDKSDDVELCDHVQFLITEVASATKTAAASVTAATTSSSVLASNSEEQPVDDGGDVVTDGEFDVCDIYGAIGKYNGM